LFHIKNHAYTGYPILNDDFKFLLNSVF